MPPVLEILNYTDPGYRPLLRSNGWMVALLNADELCDYSNAIKIERHIHTDEVFILWRGKGAIFTLEDSGIVLTEMEPGVIYNVRPGGWHGVISTPDASWIIVEAAGTDTGDTEVRVQTQQERARLLELLPDWAVSGPIIL